MLTLKEVQRLWRIATGFPWPRGWTIEWVEAGQDDGLDAGYWGETNYAEKTIFMDLDDPDPISTLIHEFVHVVHPGLPHGDAFRTILNLYRRKLGMGRVSKKDLL